MNHANKARGATEEGDMLRALQLMMTKVIKQDLKSADAQQDYQLEDFKMRKSQPRGDSLRRLLRSLVTKGMPAHVDETIQEDNEGQDYQLEDFNIRKSQPRGDPLRMLLRSLVTKGMSADVEAQQDYQLKDFKMRKSQPRGDPLRRLLRSLVTKGMSAHVDATIQEDDEDPEMKALKEQLRTFQTRLEAFQDKMRSARKEGNLMGHESEPWGGVEANESESVKFVTGTGVTLTEGLAALFPEADTPTGD